MNKDAAGDTVAIPHIDLALNRGKVVSRVAGTELAALGRAHRVFGLKWLADRVKSSPGPVRLPSGMMKLHREFDRLELAGLTFEERYRLLNGSVIPRPM